MAKLETEKFKKQFSWRRLSKEQFEIISSGFLKRKKKIFSFLFLSILILLMGCATSYKSHGFSGGYSETQLDVNVFKVSFRGNGYTSRERASDFTLLRCAELTLNHGFKFFVIVDSNSSTSYGTYTTPTTTSTTANVNVYGNSAYGNSRSTTYGGQTFIISKPSLSNTIMCYKEKPDINGLVYNAEFVSNSLKTKYNLEKN